MADIKQIKISPENKEYICGGEKLRSIFGKDTDMTPLAESVEELLGKKYMLKMIINLNLLVKQRKDKK